MNFLNRFKYARDSYIVTLLILAIAVMVNYIAARHFVRVDLTRNQLYAVSDATKHIMGSLDDIVTVKAFFSEKLPPDLYVVRQYVDDMLDEFASYSNGNLLVQFLDPSEPDVMTEALQLGIPQIRMNIIERDKFEVKNGFLGIAVMYGNRTEVIPVIQDVLNVEYELAAAIKKTTANESKVVGFVTGHEEPTLEQQIGVRQADASFATFREQLERNYQVLLIDLPEDGLLNVDTLILAGSQTAFTDEEKYAIDQFLMRGGNLIVLLDTVKIADGLQTEPLALELDDFLSHYGIRFQNHLVLDRSNETASFSQGFMNFILPYPYWVKAVRSFFDPDNPIVNRLDSLVLPWTSSVRIIPGDTARVTDLVRSTDTAWDKTEPFNLDPSAVQASTQKRQYTLGALLEGEFSSYFNGPVGETDEGHEHLTRSADIARIIAVPNSRFVTDQFVRMFQQNLVFAMNAVDFLTLDESLIQIRSKTAFEMPLKDLSSSDRSLVKGIGTYLMPVLVVLFGIARLLARKRKKYFI